jgi:hypothetical protein
MKRFRSTKLLGMLAGLALLASCSSARTTRPLALDPVQLRPDQRAQLDGIRAKLGPLLASQPSVEAQILLAMDELYRPLTSDDRAFLDAIRAQPGGDPSLSAPAEIEWVRIEGQMAHSGKIDRPIPLQLLTREAHRAFLELDRAMRKDLGRGLLIGSAYRSPAYQLYLVVEFLPRFGYSLERTLPHVSLPGGSDHNHSERLGLDFVSEAGVDLEYSHPAQFMALPEYQWLLANGARYGFDPQPVPEGEPVTSPWHWRHVGGRLP